MTVILIPRSRTDGPAMTTSTAQDTRYPLDGIRQAITAAMEGAGYTSTAEWEIPAGCQCRQPGGRSCLIAECGTCQGHVIEQPVSPDHSLTPDELIAVLPVPDDNGMVSGREVAGVLQPVILARLSWSPVWLSSLARRLTAAFEELEDSLAADNRQQPAPGYTPKCQHCGNPIAAARGPRARYCSNSHRVMASRARKRGKPGALTPRPLLPVNRQPGHRVPVIPRPAGQVAVRGRANWLKSTQAAPVLPHLPAQQ